MTPETAPANPLLSDIRTMLEHGIHSYLLAQPLEQDTAARIRQAYEVSWEHLYATAFVDPSAAHVTTPRDSLAGSFDRIWSMSDDPQVRPYAEFASLCGDARRQFHDVEQTLGEDCFFETQFDETLRLICQQGNITVRNQFSGGIGAGDYLKRLMTSVFTSMLVLPTEDVSVRDLQVQTHALIYG